MTAAPDTDSPRDAHLLAALRHAPDRDVAPPAELSAHILGQARQAVQGGHAAAASRAGLAGLLKRWFDGLSRPLAAGAVGSVLVAGLVGLMWREGPPPQALPGSEPVAVAPVGSATGAAPAAAADSSVAALTPPTATPAADPAAAPAAATTPAAAPAPLARARAPAAAPAPPPAAPSPQARAPAPPPHADVVAATKSAENHPAARPAAPEAASPPPEPAQPLRSEPSVAAALPAPAAPAGAGPALAEASSPSVAADRARVPPTRLAALPPVDPLRQVVAALSAAADDDWRQRLLALQARAQGRWSRSPAPAPEGGSVVSDASGQVWGRLWLDGLQLQWQDREGQLWQATLIPP